MTKISLARTHDSPYLRGVRPVFGHRFRGLTRLALGKSTGRLRTSGDPRWIQCEGVPQDNAPAGTHGTRPTKPATACWRRPAVVDVAQGWEKSDSSRVGRPIFGLFAGSPSHRGDHTRLDQGADGTPPALSSRWFARVFLAILGPSRRSATLRGVATGERASYRRNPVPPPVLAALGGVS